MVVEDSNEISERKEKGDSPFVSTHISDWGLGRKYLEQTKAEFQLKQNFNSCNSELKSELPPKSLGFPFVSRFFKMPAQKEEKEEEEEKQQY